MTGYNHCACRDCFEIIIGEPTDLCDDCHDAGCEPNADTECCSAHSYGGSDDESTQANHDLYSL